MGIHLSVSSVITSKSIVATTGTEHVRFSIKTIVIATQNCYMLTLLNRMKKLMRLSYISATKQAAKITKISSIDLHKEARTSKNSWKICMLRGTCSSLFALTKKVNIT